METWIEKTELSNKMMKPKIQYYQIKFYVKYGLQPSL